MADEKRVREVLIEVLKEVQSMSGRRWTDIEMHMAPIGVLDGFDSQSGIEATVMIEEKLSCELPVDSIFVSEDGQRALTVKQIAERVKGLLDKEGGRQ